MRLTEVGKVWGVGYCQYTRVTLLTFFFSFNGGKIPPPCVPVVVCRLYLFAEVFTGIFPLPYFQSITALRKSWKIARKSFLISAIILFSFLGAHSPSLCKCKLTWELPGSALTLPHPSATVAVNEKVVNRNVCENSNFFFLPLGLCVLAWWEALAPPLHCI